MVPSFTHEYNSNERPSGASDCIQWFNISRKFKAMPTTVDDDQRQMQKHKFIQII